jgi:hypothetical protein
MEKNENVRKWIYSNAVFLAIQYAGLLTDQIWLATIAASFVWLMLIGYFLGLIGITNKEYADPAPIWLSVVVDGASLWGWIYFNWTATAIGYLLSVIALRVIYFRAKKQS